MTATPKWQRARLLPTLEWHEVLAVGDLIWVQVGPPVMSNGGWAPNDVTRFEPCAVVYWPDLPSWAERATVPLTGIEMLSIFSFDETPETRQ